MAIAEPRTRRVLLIENSIGLAGSTVSLCYLVSRLDRRRYEPYLVFSRPEQQEYWRTNFDASVPSTVIRCRDSVKRTRVSRALLGWAARSWPACRRTIYRALAILDVTVGTIPYGLRLYQLAKQRRVELVHQNNGFDPAALLCARLLRVPLVAYQRGEEWNSTTVRVLSRYVDAYIANSEATRASLEGVGVPPERMVVIHPSVDLTRFDYRLDAAAVRRTWGVPEGDVCFGIVGHLVDWKGHRVFLRAAARVIDAIPSARAFVIGKAPDGNDGYVRELRELAAQLGISHRVVWTGFQGDVPRLLQILDAVVHASVRPEPFGRVIIEAMAMRKAVVASGAGGPLEIIDHGRTGFLVPPDDADELAEKVIEVLRDPALARAIGEKAHETVRERFAMDSHVERVQRVYTAVLAGKALLPDACGR